MERTICHIGTQRKQSLHEVNKEVKILVEMRLEALKKKWKAKKGVSYQTPVSLRTHSIPMMTKN